MFIIKILHNIRDRNFCFFFVVVLRLKNSDHHHPSCYDFLNHHAQCQGPLAGPEVSVVDFSLNFTVRVAFIVYRGVLHYAAESFADKLVK